MKLPLLCLVLVFCLGFFARIGYAVLPDPTIEYDFEGNCNDKYSISNCALTGCEYADSAYKSGQKTLYCSGAAGNFVNTNWNKVDMAKGITICFLYEYSNGTINNVPSDATFFYGSMSGNTYMWLYKIAGTNVYGGWQDADSHATTSEANRVVATETWSHVCIRKFPNAQGGSVEVYVNGSNVTSGQSTATNADTALIENLYLMARNNAGAAGSNMKGFIDTVQIWNDTMLTTAQINESKDYAMPTSGGASTSGGGIEINFTSISQNGSIGILNLTNSNSIIHVNITTNNSISLCTTNSTSYSLGVSNVTQRNWSFINNTKIVDGYQWLNISCRANESVNSSVMLRFLVDTTTPVLSTDLSSSTKVKFGFSGNLTASINATDSFLYSMVVNTSQGVVHEITNINQTVYSYNLSINVSNYPLGNNGITITIADGHTSLAINDYAIRKSSLNKDIEFGFTKGYVNVNCHLGLFDDMTTQKLDDRYTFTAKYFIAPSEIRCTVTSDEAIDIVKNTAYKGWLVVPKLKKWLDFSLKNSNGNENYKINRINNNQVDVVITGMDSKTEYTFQSIGDLNVYTATYYWFYANATETSDTNIMERQDTHYSLNVTKPTGSNTYVTFYYNGSGYTPTKTEYVNNDIYNVTITQPIVTEGWNYSYPLNWTVNVSYGGVNYTSVILRNQSVAKIHLEQCNSTFTWKAINYSAIDIDTDQAIYGYRFIAVYSVWDYRNSAFYRNFTFDIQHNYANTSLCVSPEYANFRSNYQAQFSHPSYETNTIYVNNAVFNASGNTTLVYLLAANTSTTITVTLIDEFNDKIVGYTVEVYKYDLATGTYQLINSQGSDVNGQTAFGLNVLDYEYKFIVKNTAGTVVYSSIKMKLISTSYTFTIVLGTSSDNLMLKANLLPITVVGSQGNKSFNMTWEGIESMADSIELRIYRINVSNTTLIFSNSSTDSNGIMQYVVTENTDNVSISFMASAYVKSTVDGVWYYTGRSATITYEKAWAVFGESSLFITFLLVGSLMFLGIAISAEIGILLSGLGLFISIAMGFFMVSIGTFFSLVVCLGILFIRARGVR